MKIFLPKSTIFTVLFLLFVFSNNLLAQCSITSTTNTSSLVCGSSPITACNGVLYIGDGVTNMTLTINSNFNLSCLGSINFVINNKATIMFGNGANDRLTLAEGSSITVNSGGNISGGNNCTASDRIYIGTNLVSTCDGNAGTDVKFDDIISLGGTGKVTSNSPVCSGNTIQLSATPPPTGTFTYSWSGPNSFTSIIQNPTILASSNGGLYKVIMTRVSDAISITAETTVIVNANSINTPPTFTTIQPNCSTNTGQITITSPTGTGIKYSIDGLTYTNTSGVFTSLVPGTYSVTAKNSSGCISPSVSVTIAQPTKTWNGSWIPTGSPTFDDFVIINSNYSGNIEACSLTINNGATLTIPDGNFVTIKNDLTVNLGGILDIANKGSLVMINDSGVVTNNGTIKVNKTTTAYEKFDYTYWSSPFQSISIPAIFSGWRTDYAFDFHPENFIDSNADGFDDDQNDWANISSMSNPGKGFIVRMPDAGPFTGTSVVFTGNALNNGVVSPSILLTTDSDNANDWNLVGNPYPSAISADSFITQNSASISGTLYFWTHKQDISISNPGPGMYNYTQDDYAMYNLSGGVGTGTGNIEGGVAQVDTKPLGYIASGQGFFVEANVAGNLKFNNSMRSGATITNANTQFYKVATSKEKSTVKNRLWLNMENTDGMFSQQLVGYFAAATNAYDSGYDGLVSDAGNYISFYSFINEDIYKIQGRAAFNKEDQVRLGYFSSVSGTFNINIDSKEGVFNTDETPVYLEDKLLHIIHDLKKGAYSFSTQIGSFDDRFVLRYTNKENEISDKSENEITVYKDKNELVIDSKLQNISRVTVFDLYGKKLFDKELSNSKELHISNGILKNQVLVLNIKLANGQLVSKKVI